jgi:hypothetical protein
MAGGSAIDRIVPSDPAAPQREARTGREARDMSRYERRVWFERLVELRTAYREESTETTAMTVTDAMAYAERLFDDPTALEAALADERSVDEPSNHPAV